MIEVYSDQCVENLNKKLKTNFQFEINWAVIPENIDGWNWDDEKLQTCFYNSFFKPFEVAFGEMFKDKMYREEITKQVKKIQFEPGRSSMADYDFSNNCFFVKHTLGPNQAERNNFFDDAVVSEITKTIEKKLT